jgi:hypothetical protein
MSPPTIQPYNFQAELCDLVRGPLEAKYVNSQDSASGKLTFFRFNESKSFLNLFLHKIKTRHMYLLILYLFSFNSQIFFWKYITVWTAFTSTV